MTPDERQLLSGLFDRVRAASNQPRDREAETFISDAVRSQPYAPYLLAQTVIVQEQALRAANEKLQELESRLRQAEAGQQQGQGGGGSFLGNIGRSIFGDSSDQQQRQPPAPYGQQQGGYGQQPGYAPQQAPNAGGFGGQGGPWGQQAQAPMGQGGGFLKGALGAAAGVAGGVLLADGISSLFRGSGNNPFGIASGFPGAGAPSGETVINNYYENDPGAGPTEAGYDQAGFADDPGGIDQADFDGGDGGFGSDDSYNV